MSSQCSLVRLRPLCSSFFVEAQEYTCAGVGLWRIFRAHVAVAKNSSKPLFTRILHASLALLEFLPIVGQLVSIVEYLMFKILQPSHAHLDQKQISGKKSEKEIIKENVNLITNCLRNNKPFPELPKELSILKNSTIETETKIYIQPRFDELLNFTKKIKNEFADYDVGLLFQVYECGDYCSVIILRNKTSKNIEKSPAIAECIEEICATAGYESGEIVKSNERGCVNIILKYKSTFKV